MMKNEVPKDLRFLSCFSIGSCAVHGGFQCVPSDEYPVLDRIPQVILGLKSDDEVFQACWSCAIIILVKLGSLRDLVHFKKWVPPGCFRTSTEGMSRDRLYTTLAALQWSNYKALDSFLLVKHPQTSRTYVIEEGDWWTSLKSVF